MTFSNTMRIAPLAAAALLCVSAVAQTRYCLGGDLAHLSAAEKSNCNAKLQAAISTASTFPAPEGWHFIMVCGEEGWKSYSSFAGRAELLTAAADTDLEQHETFLRSESLDLNNLAALRRTVAREVAGIVLHSHDELAINNQVGVWMSKGTEGRGL